MVERTIIKHALIFVVQLLIVWIQPSVSLSSSLSGLRVMVVGGSGRVGGSCVNRLVKQGAAVVTVGGTNRDRFEESKATWKVQRNEHVAAEAIEKISFVQVDKENTQSVSAALQPGAFDLVVHTAGPFQGKVGTNNGVLEACIESGTPYMDVCDDYCTARAAKTKFDALAKQKGIPCIISTGCWPGVSSLMAKQLVRLMLKHEPNLKPSDLEVNFSFFTAGSGGAGVTLLVATFLILSEKALTIVKGRRKEVSPMTEYSTYNFGDIIGDRAIAHLNLLETASIHDTLGVGSTQSLFGTAPPIWNWLLGVMARTVPADILANESWMLGLSQFSLPIVRLVDILAGATNAMRVDVLAPAVSSSDETKRPRMTAIYGHENLEPCVGECVVAFAAAIRSGIVAPGVSFPEEAIAAGDDIASVLQMASTGAHTRTTETENVDSAAMLLKPEHVWGAASTATINKRNLAS